MKTTQASPVPEGETADITSIDRRLDLKDKAVTPKAAAQRFPISEYGSGWYHDAAIQGLKEVH